jgi:hypothetical protein
MQRYFAAALALGVGLMAPGALADVQPVHDSDGVMLAQNSQPSTASGQPGNDMSGTGQPSATGTVTPGSTAAPGAAPLLVPMPFGVTTINPSTLNNSSILSAPSTLGTGTGVAQAPPVGIVNPNSPSTAPNPNIINNQTPTTVPNPNIISNPNASPTTTPGATGPMTPGTPGATPTGPFSPPSTVTPGTTTTPGAAAAPAPASAGAGPGH